MTLDSCTTAQIQEASCEEIDTRFHLEGLTYSLGTSPRCRAPSGTFPPGTPPLCDMQCSLSSAEAAASRGTVRGGCCGWRRSRRSTCSFEAWGLSTKPDCLEHSLAPTRGSHSSGSSGRRRRAARRCALPRGIFVDPPKVPGKSETPGGPWGAC